MTIERINGKKRIQKVKMLMEDILISVACALLAYGLSGIVGNRADATVLHIYRQIVGQLKGDNQIIRHSLQRIVLHSFLLSLSEIYDECLIEIKSEKKQYKEDISWFNEKRRLISEELKLVDKREFLESPIETLDEIELLLTSDGELAMGRFQNVKSKLIEKAMDDDHIPSCYEKKVREDLFKKIRVHFASEYSQNNEARRIFMEQVLIHIDSELAGQRLSLDHLLTAIGPQVIKEIDELKNGQDEIKAKLNLLLEMVGTHPSRESSGTIIGGFSSSGITEGEKEYLDNVEQIANESEDEWSFFSIQGNVALLRGNYVDAWEFLDRALNIAGNLKDERKLADSYFSIACLHLILGEFEKGIKQLNRSIDLLKKLNDITNLARAFNNLAITYQKEGELDKALNTFILARKMMKENDYHGYAITLRNIGRIDMERGDFGIALQKYEETLSFLNKELDYPSKDIVEKHYVKQLYANTLCDIAHLNKIRGEYGIALDHYKESLEILEKIGDRIGIARIKGLMAEFPLVGGKYEEALEMLKDSLETMEQAGNKKEIAHAREDIGRLYLHKEEFELAKENLEESIRLFEEIGDRLHSRSAMHTLAMVYEHKGELERALKMHEEILEFSTRIGDKLGIALSKHQLGLLHLQKKEYGAALEMFEDALKINKEIEYKDGIARALYQIAVVNIDRRDFPRANKFFSESLEMATKLGDIELLSAIHGGLGNLHADSGEYEKSIQEYEKCLEIVKMLGKKDSVIRSLLWICDVYKKMGKLENAENVYKEALKGALEIEDNKYRAIVLVGIGLGFRRQGDHKRAIECYDKAIEANKKDVWAWNNKGEALDALGKPEEAINMYDKALQLHPNLAEALGNKGLALYHLHNSPQEAIEFYDKALEIKPNLIEALYNKGNTLRDLADYEGAIVYFEKTLSTDPKYVRALNMIGICLQEMGRYDEAIEYFDKAIEADPQEQIAVHRKGQCLYNIGVSYYQEKDYKRALSYLMLASTTLIEVNAPGQSEVAHYIEKIRKEISAKQSK